MDGVDIYSTALSCVLAALAIGALRANSLKGLHFGKRGNVHENPAHVQATSSSTGSDGSSPLIASAGGDSSNDSTSDSSSSSGID